MDALIISCGTGGGHNSAGKAICEELKRRGNKADFMDPYELQSGRLSETVANVYIRLVQRMPHVFGLIYQIGEIARYMPCKSPVYYANKKTAGKLEKYLEQYHYDIIITPHLFTAEMLTYLKRCGALAAHTVFVATDYTCIPFTEETECEYYIIPGENQVEEFVRRGIPREKIKPFGIPVAGRYYELKDKKAARKEVGLSENKKYILLAGGSIGAGKIKQAVKTLRGHFKEDKQVVIIVICGNNEKLYHAVRKMEDERLIVLEKTDKMAFYIKACDLFVSKAGGLSSTEAAVSQIPLIQIPSIPGCETHNRDFFSETGMSIAVKNVKKDLKKAITDIKEDVVSQNMVRAQGTMISNKALYHICNWLEELGNQ